MVVGMDGGGSFVASHRSNVRLCNRLVRDGCKAGGDSEAMVDSKSAMMVCSFVWRLRRNVGYRSIVRLSNRWMQSKGRIVSNKGYGDNVQSSTNQTTLKWIVSMNK